jgi:hypothetical protein
MEREKKATINPVSSTTKASTITSAAPLARVTREGKLCGPKKESACEGLGRD